MTFQNGGHERGKWPGRSLGIKCQIAAIGVKKSPSVSASISGEILSRFSLAIKFAVIGV